MLIDPGTIADRFEENLAWTERLDLVSAWATEHDGLRLLEKCAKRGLKVRAIVGLWNYITEPKALRRLGQLGKLRLVDSRRRFHPKVYVFRGKARTCAWIGSANFTAGGFAVNEEAVFETGDSESVIAWFNNLWQDCGRLDEEEIAAYERARTKNPPPHQSLVPVAGGGMTEPMKLLERVTDWDSYVAALRDCDVWWSNNRPWSVLGESMSWRHTIEVLHDVLTRGRLADLDYDDRLRVLGIRNAGGEGLLGRMMPRLIEAVFVRNVEGIQQILREVSEADDSAFPDLAFDAYGRMIGLPDIGQGIASRLLLLARPDRFVSVNNGSLDGLAQYAELVPRKLGGKANYQKLLEFIYNEQWFQMSEPDSRLERSIWGMRAALLDCFVYQS